MFRRRPNPALAGVILAACTLAASANAGGVPAGGPLDPAQPPIPESAAYVPREVVVGRADGGERVVELGPDEGVAESIDALESRPGVRYAVPNWIAHTALQPLDGGTTLTLSGWALDQWSFLARPGGVRVRSTWDRMAAVGHPGGRGATVAVVDTGVAYDEAPGYGAAPDFAAGQFVAPRDLVDDDTQPLDSNGHGTHVAATIGEQVTLGKPGTEPDYLTGIAYGAKVMPIRVLDEHGAGPATLVAAGIRWASAHGADVINLSFQFHQAVSTCDQVPTVCAAVRQAKRRGSLVVAAAGNSVPGKDRRGALFPAGAPGVLGVGATTEHGCLAAYSHYGPGVELVAPGGGVPATNGLREECAEDQLPVLQLTYDCYPECGPGGGAGRQFAIRADTGTSMASAHASAVAALVAKSRAAGPHPTPRQLIKRLTCTARSPGARLYYRAGLLDAFRAVRPHGALPLAGRANDVDAAGRVVGDLVRDAPEEEAPGAGHALVPDHDQVRLGLLGHVEDRIGWIAFARVRVDLELLLQRWGGGRLERGVDVLARSDRIGDVAGNLTALLAQPLLRHGLERTDHLELGAVHLRELDCLLDGLGRGL
jgi:serine protease